MQQGFRIFSPSDFVEGADEQEEFNKRRAYVLLMEKNLDDLLDRTVKLVKEQEQSAKLFYQFGYAQRELCQSFKGDSPHNAKAQSNSENFYQLCAELKEISQRQVRQEIYHFSDVVLEYKQSMACLKVMICPYKHCDTYRFVETNEYKNRYSDCICRRTPAKGRKV